MSQHSAKRANFGWKRRQVKPKLHLVFCLPHWPELLQLNRDDEPCGFLCDGRETSFHPQYEEFDPGSGRTLAACLMHASRTECLRTLSGARLSNTWVPALEWGITHRKIC